MTGWDGRPAGEVFKANRSEKKRRLEGGGVGGAERGRGSGDRENRIFLANGLQGTPGKKRKAVEELARWASKMASDKNAGAALTQSINQIHRNEGQRKNKGRQCLDDPTRPMQSSTKRGALHSMLRMRTGKKKVEEPCLDGDRGIFCSS